MKGLLVARLLASPGIYHLQTRALGRVEIRHQRCDLPSERAAFDLSRQAFGEPVPDPDLTMRIVTLVETSMPNEAETIAEERFEEVLDAAFHASPVSRVGLSQAGCITVLSTGRVEPRLPKPQGEFTAPTFMIRREWFERIGFEQWLFSFDRTDLKARLIRSYHWSRKATTEGNRQLRVLFRWFAMETIWMLTRNDDIIPRILWSLGFANGPMAAALSPAFRQKLVDGHPAYRHWHAKVADLLRVAKELRNNSVHNGFRQQDVPAETLSALDDLTRLACPRVQRMAVSGLTASITTAQELFGKITIVLEGIPHVVDDLHGTVIFSLEDPHRLPVRRAR